MQPSDLKKTLLIDNPASGVANHHHALAYISSQLAASGRVFEILSVDGKKPLAKIIDEKIHQGFKLIIVIGGDGTISRVVDAIAYKNVILGIIPLGTGNALARELNIPLTVREALALILGQHRVCELDAMFVNQRYCILNISIGISSRLIADTPEQQKNNWGKWAYLSSFIKSLGAFKLNRFHLTIDGKKKNIKACEVMVTNGKIFGIKPFNWAEKIFLNDGVIDLCFIRTPDLLTTLGFIFAMIFTGRKIDNKYTHIPVHHVLRINSRDELAVQADGDYLGHLPVTIQVMPKAYAIITPESG